MPVQLRGHNMGVIQGSLNVASVAANTSAEQTFTVMGLRVGDFVSVNKPTLTAGLNVGNARVSAADTLALTFGNHTAAPLDPAAEVYTIFWMRPETIDTVVVIP